MRLAEIWLIIIVVSLLADTMCPALYTCRYELVRAMMHTLFVDMSDTEIPSFTDEFNHLQVELPQGLLLPKWTLKLTYKLYKLQIIVTIRIAIQVPRK